MPDKNTKKKWSSYLRLILWVLFLQFILLNVSAFLYAGRLTKFVDRAEAVKQKNPTNIFSKTWRLFTGKKIGKAIVNAQPVYNYEPVILKTKNNLALEAWYAKTDSVAKGTVVLFHGLSNSKSMSIQESNEFRFMGYNVMLVDFRAHGNSEGNTTTIGWNESEDVKLAYDWLVQKGESKIFLWGFSMGSVAVLKAVSENNLEVAGVILEMPFGSLLQHMKGRAPTFGFPKQPFGFLVTFWTGVRRGFNGFKFNLNKYAEKLNCPVLYQWAVKDIYVTKTEAETLFNHIGSKQKKMVVYENAIHGSLVQQNITKWRIEIEGFLNSK
jgi:uncharacterized protein